MWYSCYAYPVNSEINGKHDTQFTMVWSYKPWIVNSGDRRIEERRIEERTTEERTIEEMDN